VMPQCEATDRCPHVAYAQFFLKGVHADKREPTNTCRIHASQVLADFLSVSPNNARVRKAV
jgi:hypothetical protein